MSPTEYEKQITYWLALHGFYNIQLTRATGDFGADILAERTCYRYVIQCKYYTRPVGYHAVEEVLGALHYYGAQGALIVTNSTFTRQAKKGAQKTGVLLFEKVIPSLTHCKFFDTL